MQRYLKPPASPTVPCSGGYAKGGQVTADRLGADSIRAIVRKRAAAVDGITGRIGGHSLRVGSTVSAALSIIYRILSLYPSVGHATEPAAGSRLMARTAGPVSYPPGRLGSGIRPGTGAKRARARQHGAGVASGYHEGTTAGTSTP